MALNLQSKAEYVKTLTSKLAYHLLSKITQAAVAMPTHLCAAIILNFRNGIKKPQLLKELQWLRMEVTRRGGQVILVEGTPRNYLVDRPIKMLGDLIAERRHEFFVPNTESLDSRKNYISLGLYRNKILHLFSQEALWAIAYYACINNRKIDKEDMGDLKVRDTWVSAKTLLKHVLFLDKLLSLEFVRDRSSTEESDNMAVLLKMIDNGTFRQKKAFDRRLVAIELLDTEQQYRNDVHQLGRR